MERSRLQLWTDVSQIIGAVAVVLSLVYVGIEIRRNTEATRAATRQAISQTDLDFIGASLDPAILIVGRSKEELSEVVFDLLLPYVNARVPMLEFGLLATGDSDFPVDRQALVRSLEFENLAQNRLMGIGFAQRSAEEVGQRISAIRQLLARELER